MRNFNDRSRDLYESDNQRQYNYHHNAEAGNYMRRSRDSYLGMQDDYQPRHFGSRRSYHADDSFGRYPDRNAFRPDVNEHSERSWWDKAGDEVLSWLGDDYAIRRRRQDGVHRGKGPKNYVRSDDRIREDINDKLTEEWNIDASDIEVTVGNGEVILTGFVTDKFQKRRAEDLAEQTPGVKQVENRIKVDPYVPKENVSMIP